MLKNFDNCLPSSLIQCFLQIGSTFLAVTASYGFFRLGTRSSFEKGGFWVTLRKSNVFLWTVLSKYSEAQLFLSLIVAIRMWNGFTADVIWVNTKECSVTSESTKSSGTCIASSKESPALLLSN